MSQSTTKLVLRRAMAMIAEPERWLQGDWKWVDAQVGFRRCAYQAVFDAAREIGVPASGSIKALMKALGEKRHPAIKAIPMFNDRSSHKEVLALFELALDDA